MPLEFRDDKERIDAMVRAIWDATQRSRPAIQRDEIHSIVAHYWPRRTPFETVRRWAWDAFNKATGLEGRVGANESIMSDLGDRVEALEKRLGEKRDGS